MITLSRSLKLFSASSFRASLSCRNAGLISPFLPPLFAFVMPLCPTSDGGCSSTSFSGAAVDDPTKAAATKFINYVNKSPSPYHAVEEIKADLVKAGFTELKETDSWSLSPGDLKFVTKNQSTIVAFAIGKRFKPGNGFSIVGAHTDSPCLKIKPISKKKEKDGYIQVGVECYGGGIWHTWFDRDLKIAGRVLIAEAGVGAGGESTTNGVLRHRLFHVNKPIMRIPNLAIHLDRNTNDKFSPNKETHLLPIIATAVKAELENTVVPPKSPTAKAPANPDQSTKHSTVLVKLICDELDVKAEQILDFEIVVADATPAVIGGAFEEFLFSPRLDNLVNAYASAKGLIDSLSGSNSLDEETNVRMVSLFDNEEVGSQSAQGAESMFQENVLRRITTRCLIPGNVIPEDAFETAIAKSLMISADQAHAVHPNYGEKHEDNHRPSMHGGVVIKFNCNQKYATTAITTSILREVAKKAGVPLQDFVVRNDSPCGSTIGPIMSARLGMATVDVGCPQLAMHSIREMGCTSSIKHCVDLYSSFFISYPAIFQSILY